MNEEGPSATALITAVARGQHRIEHRRPWVLDDPYALVLVGPQWHDIVSLTTDLFTEQVANEAGSGVLARARYAEDRVAAAGLGQYVILGAGLDTFAWRRPDLLHDMKVFEIDHPSTQLWKRQRAVELGLPAHPNHVFMPVDLENTSVREGLDAVGFDWTQPAVFSWLAVTMYLTPTAIEDTLRAFAACPSGSEIVLTYAPIPEQLDDVGREFVETLAPFAADGGEPIQTTFDSGEIEALLERCGLQVVDHPTRDEIRNRYFADRTDGLQPYTCERLVAAQVMA